MDDQATRKFFNMLDNSDWYASNPQPCAYFMLLDQTFSSSLRMPQERSVYSQRPCVAVACVIMS
eukprot:6204180-Pleurochrysis_carterae.AAC.3